MWRSLVFLTVGFAVLFGFATAPDADRGDGPALVGNEGEINLKCCPPLPSCDSLKACDPAPKSGEPPRAK